ncbi:MAG: c-type cytochrome, partial [Ignavibacteria bacterium]|nr:c-type cytochrome [Ignavibacteria bacterium]
MKNRKYIILLAGISIIALAGFLTVRNSKLQELGIGPVKEVKLSSTIDEKLVTHGKQLFDSKCAMCHMMNQCKVGPLMQGVTKRRKPEYIMNMILNPLEMTKSNATA